MTDFDDIIGDAVARRAAGAPTARPDFAAILDARQRRVRRHAALGAGALVAAGVVAIAGFAGAGGGDSAGVADGPPDEALPSGANWYCEGRIDVQPGGEPVIPTTTIVPAGSEPGGAMADEERRAREAQRALEAEMEARAGEAAGAPTELDGDDAGFFASCTPLVASTETTETTVSLNIGTTPVSGTVAASTSDAYVVQPGDFPLKVADRFCVSVEDLVEVNAWLGTEEFPTPGAVVAIPPLEQPCPRGETETTALGSIGD